MNKAERTRKARDPDTGEVRTIPRDMGYKEWDEWQKAGRPDIAQWRASGSGSEALNRREAEAQMKSAAPQDWKEWEKIKQVLPDDAPSFSGFRAMKAAGSERYLDLKSDYRYALKVMAKDDILLSEFHRSLPTNGNSGVIKDLIKGNGGVKQRGFYGEDGLLSKIIDTNDHGNPKTHPYGAHAHDFDWSNSEDPHGKERPLTNDEIRQNKDILGGDEE